MKRKYVRERDPQKVRMGKRVRQAREALGCSAAEFGALVGLRPTFVNEVERGDKGLSLHALRKVCRVAKVTSDWMLGITEAGGPGSR